MATKQYDFPVIDYDNEYKTAEHAERQDLKVRLDAAIALVKEAEKANKRSPKKWETILNFRRGQVEIIQRNYDAVQAVITAKIEARRDAHNAILFDATESILREFGPVHVVNDHTKYVRIHLAESEYDILVVSRDRKPSFSVDLVDQGTEKTVFGYDAQVYAPDQRWGGDVKPAYPHWGSYSGMDTVQSAETMLAVLKTATHVAQVTNEVFGL